MYMTCGFGATGLMMAQASASDELRASRLARAGRPLPLKRGGCSERPAPRLRARPADPLNAALRVGEERMDQAGVGGRAQPACVWISTPLRLTCVWIPSR